MADVFDTVPVQYDPWDTSPPVPSTSPSGGLGIPPQEASNAPADDLGKSWSSGYKPVDRLFGFGGEERQQLWPERMIRSGVAAPHDAYTGDLPMFNQDTGRTSDEMIGRATDMAGTVALGTAPAPAAARGSAGVFLGPMGKRMLELQRGEPLPEHPAAVANMRYGEPMIKDPGLREAQVLGTAKMREAAGMPENDTFSQTGWFKGADGQMRREVPDLGARLVPALDKAGEPIYNKYGAEFRYEHPAGDLHAAYDLPNITVGMNHPSVAGGGASFDPKTRQIHIGANPHTQTGLRDANSVINHEIQHAIQNAEGFTGGGNPTNSPLYKEYYADGKLQPDIGRNLFYEGLLSAFGSPSEQAKKVYRSLQGETEARNAETRRAKGYNYLKHPELTEDVPRSEQIIPYSPRSMPSDESLRSLSQPLRGGKE